jgi:hypothetical protein
MRRFVLTLLVAGVVTSGCSARFPFLAAPEVPKEAIETKIRSDLKGSNVASLTIERRSVKWVQDNEQMLVGTTGGLTESSEVWVGTLTGDINPEMMPGQSSAYTYFSRLVILFKTEDGEPLGYKGLPNHSGPS